MNIERLTAILREAAAKEIMPRFRRLDEGTIRTKSHAHDLVTEADEASERFITEAIKSASPQTVVIGEEAVAANPKLLDTHFENETVVYVDPVDGTWNFAAGLPLFAVMAAVVQKGEVVAGVIYDPLGDDWVMTERGCGCFQVFPDGRMVRQKFADPVPLDRREAEAIFRDLRTDLTASPAAREIAQLVLTQKPAGSPPAVQALLGAEAVALLPPFARSMLALERPGLAAIPARAATWGMGKTLRWAFRQN